MLFLYLRPSSQSINFRSNIPKGDGLLLNLFCHRSLPCLILLLLSFKYSASSDPTNPRITLRIRGEMQFSKCWIYTLRLTTTTTKLHRYYIIFNILSKNITHPISNGFLLPLSADISTIYILHRFSELFS